MGRWFEDRRKLAVVGVVLGLILLIAGNVLVTALFPAGRLDLTRDRLYTLSSGTRQVLRQIDEPVTLRFFLSERLVREVPAYGAYATRVRDLLREYIGASGGKLRVQTFDPEPFSDVEDRAVALGLQGVPVDQGGEQVYFGLAGANTTDDEEVIAFFQPEREPFLEYDLTRLVGLITTLPREGDMMMAQMQGGMPSAWAVLDQMRQFFSVRTLGTDLEEVPADIDVLMLAHPAGLSDKTKFAIDQYVLKGGKALVFVDPHSETTAFRTQAMMMRGMPPTGGASPASDLEPLFAKWGIKMDPQSVIADRRLARRVNAGGSSRMQAADYLAWISVPAESTNRTDPVTADVQRLNLATVGILEPVADAKTKLEPLVSSSVQSMHLAVSKVATMGPPDILGILRGFKTEGKALTIAARVSGPAETAYPDGPPAPAVEVKPAERAPAQAAAPAAPAAGGAQAAEPAKKEIVKQGDINVIVVADSDMLDDRFWVQTQQFFGQKVAIPSANNADFVVNALDNLTGSNALISLRSRGISDRPFTLVRALQQDAESQFRAKEQELQDRVKETEKKLADLRGAGKEAGGGQAILTPEQAREIDNFRGQLIQTRGELRDVQRALRRDIDRLQSTIRFVNIGLIPLLVAIAAVVVGILRVRRRRHASRVSHLAEARAG
ncbi:MAG: Gldg family protein [Proteobacteria bacterium]|nr:Gldg family protein [Pseudomonadota bacterium]